MREARRLPGSEWLKDRPKILEWLYTASKRGLVMLYPLLSRISSWWTERALGQSERVVKGYLFNCQMCGQCTLHSTGMTCPMNCPKNLRNGPCGGVRASGHCEVIPEMPCVWVQAWRRDTTLALHQGEIETLQPPLNHTLRDSSAWANELTGASRQTPAGWRPISLE